MSQANDNAEKLKTTSGTNTGDQDLTPYELKSAGFPIEQTNSFNASFGSVYVIKHTIPITITLPGTIIQAKPITLISGASAKTNNITIARNGNTIGRLAEDMTIDTDHFRLVITPIVSTSDWHVGGSVK